MAASKISKSSASLSSSVLRSILGALQRTMGGAVRRSLVVRLLLEIGLPKEEGYFRFCSIILYRAFLLSVCCKDVLELAVASDEDRVDLDCHAGEVTGRSKLEFSFKVGRAG